MKMEKDCECLFRKPHPTLSAEVCIDCGRNHYRLKAATGRYFARVEPKPEITWGKHDKN